MSLFAPGMVTPGRSALAAAVAELRSAGLTDRDVAARLGISRSYANALRTDPDGLKQRSRRERYRGTCRKCGCATTGCQGFNAPTICAPCFRAEIRAPHGTRARYVSGCSCDECRAANRAYMRSLKTRPVPNHGVSGYTNYGCRCATCRRAHSDRLWLQRRPKAAA